MSQKCHKMMINLNLFFSFKNTPNSKTKLEWIWDFSPTPLLGSLQINPCLAANTHCQGLAFCAESKKPLLSYKGGMLTEIVILHSAYSVTSVLLRCDFLNYLFLYSFDMYYFKLVSKTSSQSNEKWNKEINKIQVQSLAHRSLTIT